MMMMEEDLQEHAEGLDTILDNTNDGGGRRKPLSLEIDKMTGNNTVEEYYDDSEYDDHDDDDIEEDMAPLIQGDEGDDNNNDDNNDFGSSSSPPNRQKGGGRGRGRSGRATRATTTNRRSSYLAHQLAAGYDDDDKSCWTRARSSIAQLVAIIIFLFVASVIFAPPPPSEQQDDDNGDDGKGSDGPSSSRSNNTSTASTKRVDHCHAIMNMSIDELMGRIETAANVANSNNNTSTSKGHGGGPGLYDPDDAFCVDTTSTQKGDCKCPSPITPTPKIQNGIVNSDWKVTFERNKKLAVDGANGAPFDVIFYGDSITEHWMGTDMNRTHYDSIQKDNVVFRQYFGGGTEVSDAPFRGLALGIGGDKVRFCFMKYQTKSKKKNYQEFE
jgi:hypothetical protein